MPAELRDPDGDWWGLQLRIRTPLRRPSASRPGAVDGYEDLGDPRFKGRLCLRTSNNEYNQSLVADMLAKRGAAATRAAAAVVDGQRPADPQLRRRAAGGDRRGRCDVGLSNHYYLARILEEDPDFPVAPAWPDQDGAGAHTNVSGVGRRHAAPTTRADAIALIEYLTSPEAQAQIVDGGEFAANPAVPPPSTSTTGRT